MLKTNQILLRPLQDSDLSFLEKIENNEENWQFGGEKKAYSRQELSSYIKNARTDISVSKQYRFVIDLKNNPIGFIDLFDYTTESAGIGIIIFKDFRNKGFAKEALDQISDYAFHILNISQLHAKVKKDNLSSNKLFSACSFILQGEKKNLQYFIKLAKKELDRI